MSMYSDYVPEPPKEKMTTNMTTGRVRLSYVNLSKPYAHAPGSEPKFSVTLLIPKADMATKQRIDAAIAAAIQKGVADRFKGVRPPRLGIPLHDGDGVRPSDGMPFGAECKGHWVMTASSKQQVEVVDVSRQHIINPTEIYSGMYGRVNLTFFAYDSSGKKGIGCGLGPVQKLEDGEPLGGRVSAEAAFGDVPAQNSYSQQQVPPAYPQPQYQAPAQSFPQPQPIDPITGRPALGNVMGI